MEGASKQAAGTSNFLDVLAKIIFAIVLFGKLLMDPDKIPKDNSVFLAKIYNFVTTSLSRSILCRKMLIFLTFIQVLAG